MSSLHNNLAAVTDTAAIRIWNIVKERALSSDLIVQLSELNELRDRVRKAELSARRSRRIGHRKKRATRTKEVASVGDIDKDQCAA
jgi:hypothetical protein